MDFERALRDDLPGGQKGRPDRVAAWADPDELSGKFSYDRSRIFLGFRNAKGVGWKDDRHVVTVAGSRAGKGVSLMIPNLLLYEGSVNGRFPSNCFNPLAFRSNVLPSHRRMSFKAMNDRQRRNALVPFLNIADGINGWLVTFLVSKKGGSIFASLPSDSEVEKRLLLWRPAAREKLLRILHFSAFLLSGLSKAEQDVLWMIDEDDIASNDRQLTQLTSLFAHIVGVYVSFAALTLRHDPLRRGEPYTGRSGCNL